MLREEFIKLLEQRLAGIPKADLDRTLEYYNEIISDKLDDGLEEKEAIDSLGSIDEMVNNTLKDIPMNKLAKEKLNLNRKLKTWEIVLLSATSIIWVPILIALMVVVVAIYIGLWSGVIGLASGTVSCAATSLIIIPGLVDVITGNFGSGIVIIGIGMASLGMSILLGILTFELAKIMVIVCKKIVLKIKSLFIRGEKNEI